MRWPCLLESQAGDIDVTVLGPNPCATLNLQCCAGGIIKNLIGNSTRRNGPRFLTEWATRYHHVVPQVQRLIDINERKIGPTGRCRKRCDAARRGCRYPGRR